MKQFLILLLCAALLSGCGTQPIAEVTIPETSGEDNVYVIRAPITHQLKLKLKVMKKHLDDEPGPVIEGNFVKQATR